MEIYTVSKAYHWTKDSEIKIESDTLYYSEAGPMHGVQCNAPKNEDRILQLCKQIADAIREIELLNQENTTS